MAQLKSITFMLFISVLHACMNNRTKADAKDDSFIGTWKLLSRIDKDANLVTMEEPTLGSDPISLLMYDSLGNMSVQIMKRNRTDSFI